MKPGNTGTEGTYIIQLDLDRWKSDLAGTAFNVRGIPIFFEVDASEKPTGRFITGGLGETTSLKICHHF